MEADNTTQTRSRNPTARGKEFKIELMQKELKNKWKRLKTAMESSKVESRTKSIQSEKSILETVQSRRQEVSDTWARLEEFKMDIEQEGYKEMKTAIESDLEAALKLEEIIGEWINTQSKETHAREEEVSESEEQNRGLQLQTDVDESIKEAFHQYETASIKSGRTHLSCVKDEERSIRSVKSSKSNKSWMSIKSGSSKKSEAEASGEILTNPPTGKDEARLGLINSVQDKTGDDKIIEDAFHQYETASKSARINTSHMNDEGK